MLLKTNSGFEIELDEENLDNMELVDAVADVDSGNPLAVSKVCELLIGKVNRKKLYDHIRLDSGRVPIEKVNDEINDIFTSYGKLSKNS